MSAVRREDEDENLQTITIRLPVQLAGEFIGSFFYTLVAVGTPMVLYKDSPSYYASLAIAVGFAATILTYSTAHLSGAHLNPAVSLGFLVASQNSDPAAFSLQVFIAYSCTQFFGAFIGALTLCLMIPKEKDLTDMFGTNTVQSGFSVGNAFVAEMLFTFVIVFVIFQTALDPKSMARVGPDTTETKTNPVAAPLAIGFSYTVAHLVLGPITGGALNPARSFGACISASIRNHDGDYWKDVWIFILAPMVGGILAGGCELGQVLSGVKSDGYEMEEVAFYTASERDTEEAVEMAGMDKK